MTFQSKHRKLQSPLCLHQAPGTQRHRSVVPACVTVNTLTRHRNADEAGESGGRKYRSTKWGKDPGDSVLPNSTKRVTGTSHATRVGLTSDI